MVFITAHADLQTAIAALRAGATDFILKPFRIEQVYRVRDVIDSLLRYARPGDYGDWLETPDVDELLRGTLKFGGSPDAPGCHRGAVGPGGDLYGAHRLSGSAAGDGQRGLGQENTPEKLQGASRSMCQLACPVRL